MNIKYCACVIQGNIVIHNQKKIIYFDCEIRKDKQKIRKENICKNQIKKGRAGSREIIKNVIKGKSIALMIDQRVREGEKVKFFNNLATTTTIPAQLAKKNIIVS